MARSQWRLKPEKQERKYEGSCRGMSKGRDEQAQEQLESYSLVRACRVFSEERQTQAGLHYSTEVIPIGEPPRLLQKARCSPARKLFGSPFHQVAAQHSASSTVGLGDADKLKCGLLVMASLAQRCTGAASMRAGCRDDRKQICGVTDQCTISLPSS